MSEWEEFSAYRNLIKDAKHEERKHIVRILMSEHSHDPGLCGDVANYTNNGIYSDECLYLQRIYAKMNEEQ